MKIKDINYYAKFIFSTVSDTGECYSTTDRDMLKFIKHHKSDKSVSDLSIGDLIRFEPEQKVFKIKDILIRGLVEDTDTLKIGVDLSDCAHTQGANKEALFIIHITIEPV